MILVVFKIIISIAIGKNTEPRYEMRFAQRAEPRVSERESQAYPTLTTVTELKSTMNQISYFFATKKYETKSNAASSAVVKYTFDMLIVLFPNALHELKESEIKKRNVIKCFFLDMA